MAKTIEKLKSIGLLRNMLHLLAVLMILLMPLALLPNDSEDWDLVFRAVVPATTPIVIILLLLDSFISHIWKDGASPDRLAQLKFIIKSHLFMALALLLAFMTVFLPILMR